MTKHIPGKEMQPSRHIEELPDLSALKMSDEYNVRRAFDNLKSEIARLRQDKAELLAMCDTMLEDLKSGNLVSGDSCGETAGLAIENLEKVLPKEKP